MQFEQKRQMPDISHSEQALVEGRLDQVGMHGVELPLRMKVGEKDMHIPAKVDVSVSLDQPRAKGIHMSRLYLVLKEKLTEQTFSPSHWKNFLAELLESQNGLARSVFLRLHFDLPVERESLKSGLRGWRYYPVTYALSLRDKVFEIEMGGEVLYSSTCPCSAALARQLIQEKFVSDFGDQESMTFSEVLQWLGQESSILATPHAQRSVAEFKVKCLQPEFAPSVLSLIDQVEEVLQTAVQTAVKREDEQEFAKRNGQNLMFCEDAARRVRRVFESNPQIVDYWLQVKHQESLHAHDAVAQAVKGLEDGYRSN